MNKRGSMYIETLIAVTMVGLVAGMMTSRLPKLIQDTRKLQQKSKLIQMAEYVGNYVHRWSEFDPGTSKAKGIETYGDGDILESEKRINRLLWADPITASAENEYKTIIQFWETTTRDDSALVHIQVWYDTNLDDVINNNESVISFSTVVTEKGSL